ncbi:unnamed protein product [Closterium sp. NIES-65]|nr:unnamed protein product [Closterium sp. NIES-65]
MPRFNRREQLPLHIKRAICVHHVDNPRLRHVDLARWCYSQYGLRPDRSTVGRILKSAELWDVTAGGDNQMRRRGGAWPELEQAMARWIANAGPAGVPLTLQTIRDHVATMARNMGIPPTFRCSIGWVRRALRRQGVRCRAAQGEAASADMAAVRHAREKLPQLLTHLGVTPRDTFNIDETALWLSVLPRRTYSNGRIPGRKISKERLTVAFLVNADGSHVFRPAVISKAKRPHDFRPDYDPESLCYWRHNAKGWMTSPMSHVHDDEPTPAVYPDIELDDDIDDVGTLISGLALGNTAMTAAEYVAIDDGEPTSAEGAEGQPANEPESGELFDAGVGAVMDGYVDAAEWMRIFQYGHTLKMSADKMILQEKSDHSSREEVETDKEHMSTEGRGKSRSPVKRKSRVLSSLTRDDIVRLFDFPIETAARLVGVGETALKRRCRELGIVRWKHRTLMGFRNIASSLQIPSEELTRCFEEDPNLELGANLCKVRQKVYKERHQSKICVVGRAVNSSQGERPETNVPQESCRE